MYTDSHRAMNLRLAMVLKIKKRLSSPWSVLESYNRKFSPLIVVRYSSGTISSETSRGFIGWVSLFRRRPIILLNDFCDATVANVGLSSPEVAFGMIWRVVFCVVFASILSFSIAFFFPIVRASPAYRWTPMILNFDVSFDPTGLCNLHLHPVARYLFRRKNAMYKRLLNCRLYLFIKT